jgi:hypothetical protein
MNSIIGAYSVEGNNEGEPTRKFYLTKKAGERISKEVVQTHLGFTGKKRDDYVKANFPEIWGKLDVNGDGFITDQMGTTLTRMMVGDVELNNGLQLQTGEDVQLKNHYRPSPEQPWSAEAKKGPEPTAIDGAFRNTDIGGATVEIGTPGAELYDKVMPHRFAAESDDRLVNSAIANYAVEGNTDGKPNGNFYVTKGDMK